MYKNRVRHPGKIKGKIFAREMFTLAASKSLLKVLCFSVVYDETQKKIHQILSLTN